MTWQTERGISLVEATIVLMVVSILTAAAAPAASRTLDRARTVQAIEDAEAIKTAITNFRDNVFQGFTEDGTTSGEVVELLVSDGDIPTSNSLSGDDNGTLTGVRMRWDDVVGDNDAANNSTTTITVDFLERHLITNTPLGLIANDYPNSGGNRWRGSYLSGPVGPDPWGNRYAVNAGFLTAPSNTRNEVFVLSTGPDEEIDTLFEKNGITPGDDDIVIVIQRNRNKSVP